MGEILEVSTNGFHTKSITTNIDNNMTNKKTKPVQNVPIADWWVSPPLLFADKGDNNHNNNNNNNNNR